MCSRSLDRARLIWTNIEHGDIPQLDLKLGVQASIKKMYEDYIRYTATLELLQTARPFWGTKCAQYHGPHKIPATHTRTMHASFHQPSDLSQLRHALDAVPSPAARRTLDPDPVEDIMRAYSATLCADETLRKELSDLRIEYNTLQCYCYTCNVDMSDPGIRLSHLNGKRHHRQVRTHGLAQPPAASREAIVQKRISELERKVRKPASLPYDPNMRIPSSALCYKNLNLREFGIY
eukprot:CAMPEP_0182424716 /NCGR_PEP_ID=MMETSP1167-20130531/10967_1 /TAXON_ID=2988 /ORGANISM="Mallomonas Sp, Strain CCMP3275" /LENGTH=234 /DNA_ID=CAMNT_0024604735 /DNA_START=622 /DNA_END=1326 /DNA_ORIENTATION=+